MVIMVASQAAKRIFFVKTMISVTPYQSRFYVDRPQAMTVEWNHGEETETEP